MYYTMTGETFDGRQAAQMGLVNESVPRERCASARCELAKVLAGQEPMTMRARKFA